MFQLITWLDRFFERIYTEMFLEIKNILNNAKNCKFWSKQVDNILDENCFHTVNLNPVKDVFDINEHTFY